MEDGSRVYKEAYRTCKREYDSVLKKYEAVRHSMGVKTAVIRLLPILAGVVLLLGALYYLLPSHRDVLGFLLPAAGVGLALGFGGYIVSLAFGGASERDSQRIERLRSIVEELDDAWVEKDPAEAAVRSAYLERELRKTQRYSVSGIRERVMNGARSSEDGGESR